MRAMTWVPEACTLPTEERPLRVAEFDALFAAEVLRVERVDATNLRLHLRGSPQTAATARDLIGRETDCCSFFAFDLRESAAGTELEVRVPDAHVAVLDALQRRAEQARTAGAPAP